LLNSREALRLERAPELLFDELQALPPERWVVLDEVQKVPALLDEVHRLMESRGLRFVLCGSSARKLKRSGVNLLAGRALMQTMFPLVSGELGEDFDLDRALTCGGLPLVVTGTEPEGVLEAYADTYLNEEIRAEALTRNVGAFSRFLEVAARQNAQVTNISNIAREAAVARTTVQSYFEILVDTLIGYWVSPWRLKQANKQVQHPKFYLFDTGVARTLSGRLPYPPLQEELGALMETLVLGEVKAYLAYNHLRYRPYFWRTHDGTEVDLLVETRNGFVAAEIKAASQWQRRFNTGLRRLRDALPNVTAHGVYRGERPATMEGIQIHPCRAFLQKLWGGKIIA
jgi:predicted AAA+ superfamily ATPase